LIDREAIIADAIKGETSTAIARRHGCTVKDVHEILDEHASEVLTPHNRARVLSIELQRLDELQALFYESAKLGDVTPREESQQSSIMATIGALAPSQSAGGPGPFVLSAPGAAESVLEAAGLQLLDRGEMSVVLTFPTVELASQAFLAGGTGARAIQHSGEERVRGAMRETLAGFQTNTGDYRVENRFRFMIAGR
jgi:hypothetical protein